MATRIQVNLGDNTLALVDRYAEAMGVTRSALCSVLIAQGLMGYNPALLNGQPGGGSIQKEAEIPENDDFVSLDDQIKGAAMKRG